MVKKIGCNQPIAELPWNQNTRKAHTITTGIASPELLAEAQEPQWDASVGNGDTYPDIGPLRDPVVRKNTPSDFLDLLISPGTSLV